MNKKTMGGIASMVLIVAVSLSGCGGSSAKAQKVPTITAKECAEQYRAPVVKEIELGGETRLVCRIPGVTGVPTVGDNVTPAHEATYTSPEHCIKPVADQGLGGKIVNLDFPTLASDNPQCILPDDVSRPVDIRGNVSEDTPWEPLHQTAKRCVEEHKGQLIEVPEVETGFGLSHQVCKSPDFISRPQVIDMELYK